MMPANATAYLILVSAPLPPGILLPANLPAPPVGHTFPLLIAAKNILGRGAGTLILLPWLHVSRRHAAIEFSVLGSWEIEDLQSRNGTFVNGQRLSPQTLTELHEGDRILVGSPSGIGSVELLFTSQPTPQLTPKEEHDAELEMNEFRNESVTEFFRSNSPHEVTFYPPP